MYTFVALCAIGAEKILSNEIKSLGYSLVQTGVGRVIFLGGDDAFFRCNFCLRTADRVYFQCAQFSAQNFDDFFEAIYSIAWQDFFNKNVKIFVDKVRTHNSKINSVRAIQSIAQKAICQKLCDQWKILRLSENGFSACVRIYVGKDSVRVLLDLSGEPLFKRGYRKDGGVAPLRETVAQSLLHFMTWRRKTPLYDPFCGSGTIAIEAAFFAHNVAPGFGRNFAVENFSFFSKNSAQKILEEETQKIRCDIPTKIFASDIDKVAIERAKRNATLAFQNAESALKKIGRNEKIERPKFFCADFKSPKDFSCDAGIVICNPPYGARLGTREEAISLYKNFPILFKNFLGWKFGIIAEDENLESEIQKNAFSVKSLRAGKTQAFFYIFDFKSEKKFLKTPKNENLHTKKNREKKISAKNKNPNKNKIKSDTYKSKSEIFF